MSLSYGNIKYVSLQVTAWSVNMETSSAMLGIDSFIPLDEHGFWIIGFRSRVKGRTFKRSLTTY